MIGGVSAWDGGDSWRLITPVKESTVAPTRLLRLFLEKPCGRMFSLICLLHVPSRLRRYVSLVCTFVLIFARATTGLKPAFSTPTSEDVPSCTTAPP